VRELCARKPTFGSFLAVMFFKMKLGSIWPSRFDSLCSAGLSLTPQKPAAAAPATNASAAFTLTGRRQVAPINVDGLSVKVAKGEVATSVADAVLGNEELLSTVIKCALESNAQAPTLASVAQAWNHQLCWWKQQIVLKASLSKDLTAVQCMDCNLVALLHGWGAPPRNLLVGLPQPTIEPVFDGFRALNEMFADRVTTREDVLTLLDLPGGGNGWLTGGLIDAYMGSFLHDVRRVVTRPLTPWQQRIYEKQPDRVYLPNYLSAFPGGGGGRALIGYVENFPYVKEALLGAKFIDGTFNIGPNLHWVYFTMDMEHKIIYVFEPANFASEYHGGQVIRLMRDMVNDDIAPFGIDDQWDVRVVTPADGLPSQCDGKSCGVYAALIGEHIATGRNVPAIDLASIAEQRAHMFTVLLQQSLPTM
tara:strand:- start:1438 stop:2697 length:1260 start_codon:yes stop_codon:yes gene_type:complete